MGSFIKSLGYYVPKNVVKNEDLIKHMDTTDEWIQERTGIQERRYATRHEESTVSLAAHASAGNLAAQNVFTEERAPDCRQFRSVAHRVTVAPTCHGGGEVNWWT